MSTPPNVLLDNIQGQMNSGPGFLSRSAQNTIKLAQGFPLLYLILYRLFNNFKMAFQFQQSHNIKHSR